MKIASPNEEINYLKKYYKVELDVLKQENKNLRIKLKTQVKPMNYDKYDYRNFDNMSPYSHSKNIQQDKHNSFERDRDPNINHIERYD